MILVIAEQRDGKLNRASWETIAAAQQMGDQVKVAIAGSGVDALASELAAAEATEVVVAESPELAVNSTKPDAHPPVSIAPSPDGSPIRWMKTRASCPYHREERSLSSPGTAFRRRLYGSNP